MAFSMFASTHKRLKLQHSAGQCLGSPLVVQGNPVTVAVSPERRLRCNAEPYLEKLILADECRVSGILTPVANGILAIPPIPSLTVLKRGLSHQVNSAASGKRCIPTSVQLLRSCRPEIARQSIAKGVVIGVTRMLA
jgi:hypothetical protein